MEPLQIYHIYHNLWKIEESFRITKSYLDALYLTEKEIENIFEFTMLIDSWVLGFERNDGSQVILHKTEKRKTVFSIFANNQLLQKNSKW